MDLISIIVIIAFISKMIKKGKEESKKNTRNANRANAWEQMSEQIKAGQNKSRQYSSNQKEEWKRLARENIEKAKRRATNKLHEVEQEPLFARESEKKSDVTYQMPKRTTRTTPAYEQMNAREHNHSERVSPAEHHHPEDVMSENMLGKVEDLMIKGYDGNLCFERDFIGEAMDMISRFSVPSDIPDFDKDDVA